MSSPKTHRLLLLAAASDATFEESVIGFTGRCIHCKTKVSLTREGRSVDATVEHIVPRTHGGTDDLENLAIACRRCNEGKGRRLDSRRFTDPTLQAVIATLRERRIARLRDPVQVLARLDAR